MRSINVLALIAALAFFTLPASAEDSFTFSVDGIGANTCREIVASMKDDPRATANGVVGWAYGYMTRRNYERARNKLPQATLIQPKFDAPRMLGVILAFCEKQPDTRLYQAVDALFEVLLDESPQSS